MELVESLEETKRTATSVSEQVKAAKESKARLSAAREVYRPVASRGALLYFLVDSLPSLDRVYYFSMANFAMILQKGALTVWNPTSDMRRIAQSRIHIFCAEQGWTWLRQTSRQRRIVWSPRTHRWLPTRLSSAES